MAISDKDAKDYFGFQGRSKPHGTWLEQTQKKNKQKNYLEKLSFDLSCCTCH